ncbi:MAG: hypothetical protein L0099_11585 [Acidobacteria bacterium]|nr:hypothetical protein [Acidobacteriota bacterium]
MQGLVLALDAVQVGLQFTQLTVLGAQLGLDEIAVAAAGRQHQQETGQ